MPTLERQLKSILREYGCFFVRNGKGDHEIWYSPITDRHITVDSGIKSFFTANAVLKAAGIRDKKF